MKCAQAKYTELPFEEQGHLPDIDLEMTACRQRPDGYYFDIVDFRNRVIRRWDLDFLPLAMSPEKMAEIIPQDQLPLIWASHEAYLNSTRFPHSAHIAPSGDVIVCFANGLYNLIIDPKTNTATTFPDDYVTNPHMHCQTGDFSADGTRFYFMRWPLEDSLDILQGKKDEARCEVCALDMNTRKVEILHELEYSDNVHQITASNDGRYLVFTTMQIELPGHAPKDNTVKFDLQTNDIVVLDLETGTHSRRAIPVPKPAHFEFDPHESSVFYLSAHNFSLGYGGCAILAGQGRLYRFRIVDGQAVEEASYSSDNFFRLTQHMPLSYGDNTYVAVTNIPNHLEILHGKDMSLFRSVKLFEHEELVLPEDTTLLCPYTPDICFSLMPSRDGRYIVLEASNYYRVYDMQEDALLDVRLSSFMEEGTHKIGHCWTHRPFMNLQDRPR